MAIMVASNPWLDEGWARPVAWSFWWLALIQWLVVTTVITAR